MRIKDIVGFSACILLIALSSCGYTTRRSELSLGGKPSDGTPERIFVPVIDNLTVRTGFEAEMTSALRETLALEHGIAIVNQPEQARYFLVGKVVNYTREKGPTSQLGDQPSQDRGGILKGGSTAADLRLRIGLVIKLVERVNADTQRVLWVHEFGTNTTFTASRRFVATGSTAEAGSSSASYINESREKVQVKSLAKQIARQVVDQVVQDF